MGQDQAAMKKERIALVVCGALLGFPAPVFAQNDNPFSGNEVPKKGAMIKVVYEVFSLPMTKAAELQRAKLADSDFYLKLLAGLEDQSVKQESFLVSRSQSGYRARVEEVKDYIYPTEFDPPELPNMVAGQPRKPKEGGGSMRIFPVTRVNPTSFETQPLGEILEVEAVINGHFIDLQLAPSKVSLIQKDTAGQGGAKIVMPRFARPRIRTGVHVRSGRPFYLGTISAPKELQPKEGEQRVSFAFVTATQL